MKEQATFAAGCFWGVEHAFREVPGVTDVEVGYTGGTADNPTYEMVCRGDTGHAEAVHVTFDPVIVTYETLLRTFFTLHDPTQKGGQGLDVGDQYRSAIFYHNDSQKEVAESGIKSAQQGMERAIVTEIVPVSKFWRAEEYHQQYIAKHQQSTC